MILIKGYSMIDQQTVRHFVHYSKSLSNHSSFYATQLINPFLIQGSQPITIKEGIREILILLNVPLV